MRLKRGKMRSHKQSIDILWEAYSKSWHQWDGFLERKAEGEISQIARKVRHIKENRKRYGDKLASEKERNE